MAYFGSTTVGHPVDVASGCVYMSHEDAEVQGRLAITWDRSYSTAILQQPSSPFGPGWTNRYFCKLQVSGNEYSFVGPEGYRQIFFDKEGTLPRGGVLRNLTLCEEIRFRQQDLVLTRWQLDEGDIQRWVFSPTSDNQFRLSSIEDVVGRAVDAFYDPDGVLARLTQRREQRSLLFRYSGTRLIEATLVCAGGHSRSVARYEYDPQGRLKRAYDALGHVDDFTYDDRGRVTKEVSRTGGVFHFSYDQLGRCISTWSSDGYDEKHLRFSDGIGWTEVTNGHGNKWRFEWNANGQVITKLSPLGAVTRTTYDEHSRVQSMISPKGNAWRYVYDEQGNRKAIVNPLGKLREYEFNERHQGIVYRDESGNAWTGEYDDRGFLVATEDPVQRRWHYDYDERGDLTTLRGPENYKIEFAYDSLGNCLSVSDYRGHIMLLKSDVEGRLSSRASPVSGTTEYSWDGLNQLVGIQYADKSRVRFSFHPTGNISELVDETGRVTRLRYGSCGILQEHIDAAGLRTAYIWGKEPNELLSIESHRGETCSFEYDEDGRRIREVMFDGRTREFLYDESGDCIEFQSANGRTLLNRDALGRLIQRITPEGEEESFSYDDRGYLLEARNGSCAVTFEYDPVGRIVAEGRDDYMLRNEYGIWGRIRRTSQLGATTEFDWDKEYIRRISLSNGADIQWDVDSAGRIRSRSFSSGAREVYSHDLRGHLLGQQLLGPEGNLLRTSQYQYDLAGHPTQLLLQSRRTDVEYDALHQVRKLRTQGGVSETFEFDVAGNISRSSRDGVQRQNVFGRGNRLLASVEEGGQKISFSYDGEGNLLEKASPSSQKALVFKYDSSNRLTAASSPNADSSTAYKYDALGRRISKQTGSFKVEYFWDCYELAAESQSVSDKASMELEYVSSNFTPLAAVRSGEAFFYHYDQLGAPVEVRDEKRQAVWQGHRSTYDVKEASASAGFTNPWRLPGQYHDPETGLHYNGFRYYDPELGRYITQDPIGLLGGPNLYAYAANPLAYADPLGLQPPGPTPGGNTLPPYDGGKTQGVLVRPNGQETPLQSGYGSPASDIGYLPGANGNIKSHVEAHAAATMRQEGLDEASLYINRVPCPTIDPHSKGCDEALQRMLPEGSTLHVIGPDGFEKSYTGGPDPPQSKRRKKAKSC